MKPQLIPDLQDWSGSFAAPASVATDANFAWAWSDGAQHFVFQDLATEGLALHDDAAAGSAGAADTSLLSSDLGAVILPAMSDGDATAPGPAEISDGNPPLPVSDTASIATEVDSVAPAAAPFATMGHAASGLSSGVLAGPSIVLLAAHTADAGPGYSDSIATMAHPDAPIFFTGLPSALTTNGGTPATITVTPETLHAAPDLSTGPILANPAAPADLSQDPVTNAGIGSHGATAAQVQQALNESSLSGDGGGIKVGVLSDSFDDLGGATADESSGALPSAANVLVISDLSSGGTDEGRAMMQIVHDIAPGSSLAFYTAEGGAQAFADGILALANAGCKVICDDVSYLDEPFFGGGVIAQAIQTVEAEGVTYITSAGNNASNAYQAAWTPTSGSFDGWFFTDAQNFGGSLAQTITVTASSAEPVSLLLEWNDAYGQANFNSGQAPDIDMFVFHNGSLIGQATNASVGEANNPFTGYDFTASGTYQIVISDNFGPNPGLIKEIAFGDGLPVTISGANAGTVFGHATTPGVITVGAVSTADTPAFGFSTPVSETFSSSGAGSELLYNADGTALSSPVTISPVAVSSVDNISTTVTDGLGDFYGTSAASASLAGIAALVLAANPDLTPAQVEQIMEETATPMSNSAVSGAGLVNANAAVAAAEALLVKVTIESFGSASLDQLGNHFYLDSNSTGTGPELMFLGAPVFAGMWTGWAPVAAEQTTSGYDVAFENASTGLFNIWSTDSHGNYITNLVSGVSGNSSALEGFETSFHQDLNGDGTIGLSATAIESFGSTDLVQFGNTYLLDPGGGGTGPELMFLGAPVFAGMWTGWAPVAAEQTTGGYDVAFENASTGLFNIWSTDSNGNYITNLVSGVSGNSSTLEGFETSFHQDLNGDGTIGLSATAIESFGSTDLVQFGNTYLLDPGGGGTGPELMFSGAPVFAGMWTGWAPVAAEQTTGGYDVAFENASTGLFNIWSTDSNGNYITNLVSGVSGNSSALEGFETSFHQDLNGDGTIGPSATVIESFGSTHLVQSGNTYLLDPGGGGTGPELMFSGAPVFAGMWTGWAPVAAEQTTSGYDVAFENASTGLFNIWSTDSDGNYITNLVSGVSGNSSALEGFETIFHQDLNGDGTIGVVAHSSSVISMAVAATTGSKANDNFVFHPALGQQPPASPAPSGTITPDEFAHFGNGNQAVDFWSDHHAGTSQSSFQPAHDSQGETADAGNHDLANAMSVHHAELMHAYLIH